MMYRTFVFLVFIFSFLFYAIRGNAESSHQSHQSTREAFVEFQNEHPDLVFASTIGSKIKDCLKAYGAREKLPNGAVYGDSVRNYSLETKTAKEIRNDMKKMACIFRGDVLREPVGNKPFFDGGRTIPLWLFLCPDGGEVRVKVGGDPSSPYRSEPNATKGLRYPYDSKFDGFADEIVKIDNRGVAIPKARADLGPLNLVDGWADDGHTDLVSNR